MTTTSTNPASMLAGSSQSDMRIDTATSFGLGFVLIVGLLYMGYRYMRNKQRQAEAERDTRELLRRASDQTIEASLVVRR